MRKEAEVEIERQRGRGGEREIERSKYRKRERERERGRERGRAGSKHLEELRANAFALLFGVRGECPDVPVPPWHALVQILCTPHLVSVEGWVEERGEG